MSAQRRGGIIQIQVNGVIQDAYGEFEYDLGHPKRSPIEGVGSINGFTEKPKVAYVKGTITDRGTLDLGALVDTTDATVTLLLANGKTIVLRDAWYQGDGTGKTNEGEVDLEFASSSQGQEIS